MNTGNISRGLMTNVSSKVAMIMSIDSIPTPSPEEYFMHGHWRMDPGRYRAFPDLLWAEADQSQYFPCDYFCGDEHLLCGDVSSKVAMIMSIDSIPTPSPEEYFIPTTAVRIT